MHTGDENYCNGIFVCRWKYCSTGSLPGIRPRTELADCFRTPVMYGSAAAGVAVYKVCQCRSYDMVGVSDCRAGSASGNDCLIAPYDIL